MIPALLHLAEDGERGASEHAAADDHGSNVPPCDQPGDQHAADAADEEEQRRRQGDRRHLPSALAAERVQVDGEAVEPESGRRRQDDEASGDDAVARESRRRCGVGHAAGGGPRVRRHGAESVIPFSPTSVWTDRPRSYT
jgi:hypothetical protein